MKIGVFGPNGFLGSKIIELLIKNHEIIFINRKSYVELKGSSFDIFINVTGNKKNYWANQFPYKDFDISTVPVYSSIFDFDIETYIFMSSIAVYDKHSHYGFNKLLSEQIVKRHSKNYIILRCCSVIDKDMTIGIINDVLTEVPLFVSRDSQIQFITRDGVANVIAELIVSNIKNKLFNVGGIGTVKINDLEKITGKTIVYQDGAKKRHYEMDVSSIQKHSKLKSSTDYVKDVL